MGEKGAWVEEGGCVCDCVTVQMSQAKRRNIETEGVVAEAESASKGSCQHSQRDVSGRGGRQRSVAARAGSGSRGCRRLRDAERGAYH